MDLEALRAQARAVASRMDTRISAALTANRELTADENTANEADEAELADLKGKIAAAEVAAAAGTGEGGGNADAPHAAAVTAERERIMGLVDLCPASVVGSTLRTAIEEGVEPGAFAIDLAKASKARGASVADLRAGAVQPDQVPQNGKPGGEAGKVKTGAEQATGILALAAKAGVRSAAHLTSKG